MTPMFGCVMVEFPLWEAEELLKRLSNEPMTPGQCEAVQRGRERLEQAVAVERGAGGNAECSAKKAAA
jgi:hypothetical protein